MRLPAVLRDLADFCYPPQCAACGARADSWPVCTRCADTLDGLIARPACLRCAMPLPDAAGPCPYCHGEGLYPFGQILRLCVYADPVRQLVHALKFHRAWTIGEFFADRLHARPEVRDALARAEVIVPIPLHALRQVERGYDQAEVIARRLGRLARRPVRRAVVRLVATTAQTDVRSRSERIENLRHAFGLLDPAAVAGRRVMVVDDVRTTAATLQSFGRCLRQGKPSAIDAVAVAAADPRHADFQSI